MSQNEYAKSFARFDEKQALIQRKKEAQKREEFRQRLQGNASDNVRTYRGHYNAAASMEPLAANPAYDPRKPGTSNSSFYLPPKRVQTTKPDKPLLVNVANRVVDPRKHIITTYVSEFFVPGSTRPTTKTETVIVSEPRLPGETKPNTAAVKETYELLKQREREMIEVVRNSDRAGKWMYEATAKQGIVKATTTVIHNPPPYHQSTSKTAAMINGKNFNKPPQHWYPPQRSQRRASIDQLDRDPLIRIPSINIEEPTFLNDRHPFPQYHRSNSSFDDIEEEPRAERQRRIRFSDTDSFHHYPSAASIMAADAAAAAEAAAVASSGATVTRTTGSKPVTAGVTSGRSQFGFIDNFGGFRK